MKNGKNLLNYLEMNKKILIFIVALFLVFLIGKVGISGYFSPKVVENFEPGNVPSQPSPEASADVKLLSTNPNPLHEAILLPTQTIEITFNFPIENRGEFKHTFEPDAERQINLSDDRKTVIISFPKPLELGVSYTLFIKNDTKFDGGKRLNGESVFTFHTIKYNGI